MDARLEEETVWLTQAQLCALFNKNKRTISEHICNIFSEGELQEDSVVISLDAIIQLNGRELLTHAGQISHAKAMGKSAIEYEKYREDQKKIEREQSLIELERDIKSLIQKKPGKRDRK